MHKISACIITCNDADNLQWSVSSVRWVDEIVVVDNGSTDRTIEIAESLGARVVKAGAFAGFGELRNLAKDACTHDWVLSLDADEHCTPKLRDEIAALMSAEPQSDAYRVPRRNFMMGRWIRGSGWYPDFRGVQLFRKSCLHYTPSMIHEGYELTTERPIGRLRHEIWHYPFNDLGEMLHKGNFYSTLGAEGLAKKRVNMWSALGHGMWAFVRLFILKRGFVDGWAGFVIALSNFEGTFYRYAKAYEKAQGWRMPLTDEAKQKP